jgi:hypothetical protein
MPVNRTITTNATIAAISKIQTTIVCRIHSIEADSIFPMQYVKLRISRLNRPIEIQAAATAVLIIIQAMQNPG